jgi:YVTN family beta-propeller protein
MRFASLLALVLIAAGLACAGETPNPALVVLEKEDGTLAIVDPGTLQIVGRVPVGRDPHEVVVSSDGKTAYASNYSFFGTVGPGHTIAVVDLVAQKPEPPIELGPLLAPHGLDFAGGELYFTAEGAKAIGRYNPATKKIDWVMGTGQDRTHMVRVLFNPEAILTANVASGSVSILQPPSPTPPGQELPSIRGDWSITVVKVGGGSEGFDVTPDRKEMWVADADDGTVSIVDIAGKKVIATIPDAVKRANRLKFTRDGKYALISDLQGNDLTVMDVAGRSVYKKIPLGSQSEGILIAPDGKRAFVALGPGNAVDVIDLATWTVSGKIQTGRGPDGMAWAERR